jgi:two-component system alkaline phosphatase synthesis response regulator PhoP
MTGKKHHILLVDDEVGLAEALRFNLEMDGYIITLAHDGNEATGLLSTQQYDIVLLDVMMPEMDGYQICQYFRSINKHTPVIFLTSRGTGKDRIHGLRLGADDYVTKPFEYDELLLRVGKLIERSERTPIQVEDEFVFGNCSVNFSKTEATGARGEAVEMSKIEFDMMKYFIFNQGKTVSRDEIYKSIWGYNDRNMPNSRTLDNFIMFLRRYFESNPSDPKHFISVRGIGYKFVV